MIENELLWVLLVIIPIASGTFTSYVASQKGYDKYTWWFLGLFFNIFALISIVGLSNLKNKKDVFLSPKKCLYCFNDISILSSICEYCSSDVTETINKYVKEIIFDNKYEQKNILFKTIIKYNLINHIYKDDILNYINKFDSTESPPREYYVNYKYRIYTFKKAVDIAISMGLVDIIKDIFEKIKSSDKFGDKDKSLIMKKSLEEYEKNI